MKNSFKDTVTLIQKMARSIPTAPSPTPAQTQAPTPAPAAPAKPVLPPPLDEPEGISSSKPVATPSVVGSGKSAPKSSAVKEMQLAIIKLANTISASIDYNALQQAMSRPSGTPESPRKTELMSDYNTDRFSDFMTTTYLRGSDIKGSEYDTDPKKTKMDDKNPSDLKNMFSILDSLKRIGTGKSEFQPDGSWGPRTNNALQNIAGLANAIMKLGTDLGMKSSAFDASKLSELSVLIPPKDTDLKFPEKEANAKQITPLLNGANALYLDYKNQVLTKPAYRRFFEGAPLLETGPAKSNFVGDEQTIANNIESYLQNTTDPRKSVFTPKIKTTPTSYTSVTISAANLKSKEAFESWAESMPDLAAIKRNQPEKWNEMAISILNQVKSEAQNLQKSSQQG